MAALRPFRRRALSTVAKSGDNRKSKGLFGWLASVLEGPDELRVERAKTMLDFIEVQARLDYTQGCGVKQDRFRSQFGLEMLHLWIVKLNLVQLDRAEGAKMFAEVCEQVWARAEPRLYDAGINSFMLSKNMKDLQQWTFGSMTAYDQAILTLQNTEEERDFIGSLWRNVYDCDQEAQPLQVATLADYTIEQIQHLQGFDQDAMFQTQFNFLEPPTQPTREGKDMNLDDYGEPVVVAGEDSKRVQFRWSGEYPVGP